MNEVGLPALQATTAIRALILGKQVNMDSITKGKYADIIATNANPLQNIRTLRNVIFVMKDGMVYRQ